MTTHTTLTVAAIATLLFAALALPTATAVDSGGWFMHYDSGTDSTSFSRTLPVTAIPLSIPDAGFRTFAERNASQVAIDMKGDWSYSLKLEKAQPHAQDFRILIGKVGSAPGSPFVPFAFKQLTADRTTFSGTIAVPEGSMIQAGEKLAMQVFNLKSNKSAGAASKAINVMVNDPSAPTTTAPMAFRVYPTPEIAPVVLVGVGLLGIVALARRRS